MFHLVSYRCSKGHYSSVCQSKGEKAKVHKVQAQPATTQYQDCILGDYLAVHLNADFHSLKTTTIKWLNHPEPDPHIRPLRLSIIAGLLQRL